ncbi:hypothetical protein V8B97DRAFT_45956 [Scleroderma yunnanense]
MSHFDSQDANQPADLVSKRSAVDCDYPHSTYPSSMPANNSPALLDRRAHGPQGLTAYTSRSNISAIPRAYGIPDKEYTSVAVGLDAWPSSANRHTANLTNPQAQHLFSSNHHRRSTLPTGATPPVSTPSPGYYTSSSEGDNTLYRQVIQSTRGIQPTSSNTTSRNPNIDHDFIRSTLWWGGLEPWMDEEYAKQVCGLMGWSAVNIKVPNAVTDPSFQQANNPGYCFLTFPSPSVATSALNQVNGGSGGSQPPQMPNSNKPFLMNLASSIPCSLMSSAFPSTDGTASASHQQHQKEYSIFVGDLAPETSNSDLVAVFRNPLLGLRNDREPKFIRPFLSCKSAKIMLDPVTGISRGYGFVRFTDEADQQRALVEMHGLYCLSRPMRISPATAKYKPPQSHIPLSLPAIQYSQQSGDQMPNNVTVSIPPPNVNQVRSVSSPIAASTSSGSSSSTGTPVGTSSSGPGLNGSGSIPSFGSGSSASASSGVLSPTSSEDIISVVSGTSSQYGAVPLKGSAVSTMSMLSPGYTPNPHEQNTQPRYIFSEESWKHHAQARAILGNLIGPNGEQLTSTDPYNTTVFVGGLSPLISEETLRTFFAPFGDIHYVKVPAGKHCGFVQFVRKADAERAIEKMQGFPIGGSRIRLSWGRSQYKAAQAAAQAALQAQFQVQVPENLPAHLSSEQAVHFLQQLGITTFGGQDMNSAINENKLRPLYTNQTRQDGLSSHPHHDIFSNPYLPRSMASDAQEYQPPRNQFPLSFSPFSPDPNALILGNQRKTSEESAVPDAFTHLENFRRFNPATADACAVLGDRTLEPLTSVRASGGSQKFGVYLDGLPSSRSSSREEGISRPNSTRTSSQGCSSQCGLQEAYDPIQDLNGTLASLDLDHNNTWKPSEDSVGRKLRGL